MTDKLDILNPDEWETMHEALSMHVTVLREREASDPNWKEDRIMAEVMLARLDLIREV
jgi:hypothetical protein